MIAMFPKFRRNISCLLTKSVFKLAFKAFWTKIVPRLKAHPFSDFLQFMRLGIHRLLGVNKGKHGTCVAVNANPAMLPLSTTLLKVMLQDKSFRDNVLVLS